LLLFSFEFAEAKGPVSKIKDQGAAKLKVTAQFLEAPLEVVREALDGVGIRIPKSKSEQVGDSLGPVQGTLGEDRAEMFLDSVRGARGVDFVQLPKILASPSVAAAVEVSKPYAIPALKSKKAAQSSWVGVRLEVVAKVQQKDIELILRPHVRGVQTVAQQGVPPQEVFNDRKAQAIVTVPLGGTVLWGMGQVEKNGEQREQLLVVTVEE
jgi:hypothetical protein